MQGDGLKYRHGAAAVQNALRTGIRGLLVLGAVLYLAACAPASDPTTASMEDQPGIESPAAAVEPPSKYHGRTEDRFFDVLTFNTALLPEPVSYTLPSVRVGCMAPFLEGYDALVIQEAFVDGWREALVAALTDAYPYRGQLVGANGGGLAFRQNGGILILSRWPIVREAVMHFGAACSGTDCLADKGVAYAAIRKGERTYHLFGTPAQSSFGLNSAAVRAEQFELFADFVAEQDIPADEPVLLAGDFNVDAATPELDSMLATLRASWPPVIGKVRTTWDPEHNEWADGRRLWLDYVLIADGYAAPRSAWNRAVPMRPNGRDLSDHYAVWARVAMPGEP